MSQDDVSQYIGTPEETQTPEIKEKLDAFKLLVIQHITRCLQSKSRDPYAFSCDVESLLALLPIHKFTEIMNRQEEYTATIDDWKYIEAYGIKAGSLTNPIMNIDPETRKEYPIPRKKDGEIDWKSPHILSPRIETRSETEYERLFSMIIQGFEECGLTYTKITGLKDGGPTPNKIPPDHLDYLVRTIKEMIAESRENGMDLGFLDYVDALSHETPRTPVLEVEPDESE